VGVPLRPCHDDLRHFSELLRVKQPGPVQALILGVTPELYGLDWPVGARIRAADRSPEMIQAIWPGPPADAVLSEWLNLPFGDASFDRVVCDGGLHLVGYPDGHRKLVQSIARVLKPEGRFVVRLFSLPERRETPQQVLRDLSTGSIPNFHVFKLRLAMALQRSSHEGIVLNRVFQYLLDAMGDLNRIAEATGWSREEVSTVNSYRDSTNIYHFLTEAESIEALTSGCLLRFEGRRESRYPLGERCPLLVLGKGSS
jgi:SAM-dependent methyltransferase